MADAIYDVIGAGVPHRVLETDAADLSDIKLSWGQTLQLSQAAADELEAQHEFEITTEPGSMARLAVVLSFRGLRAGVMDLGSSPVLLQSPEHACTTSVLQFGVNHQLGSMAKACRLHFRAASGSTASAIHYGAVDARAGRQSAMLVRASKILFLEDRLWDVEGGAEFAAAAIDVARSANRLIVLLCRDPDCVFRNRLSIRAVTDSKVSYIVGEAATVLLLHDLQRLDSLIPRLKSISTGAVLWRHSTAPLLLEGNVTVTTVANSVIDTAKFWNVFLADRIELLVHDGSIFDALEQNKCQTMQTWNSCHVAHELNPAS